MDHFVNSQAKKFKVVTLGCRTNQYESQAYMDQLKSLGYSEAANGEVAELCIVNTCTVTESADSSSRHQIRQLLRENPDAQVVVTGCLAERAKEEILSLGKVTEVVSNKDKENLLSFVIKDQDIPEFSIKHFEAHTRAFVKVQDGCNSFCTYCIIPYVRGRSRSRRLLDILAEVKTLIANGYQEVVLTGINIGDFDGAPQEGEKPLRLADLVRAVDAVPGLKRLRISSIDPDEVDLDLIDAIVQGKTTCHSMHIVLQSGSNAILKRMNRKYTKSEFLFAVDQLKKTFPDFTFTTDIIVGFPGESEADFEETLQVMREVKFAKVHMFPYSPRERTRAALYPHRILPDVMNRRKQQLLRVAEEIAFDLRGAYVGKVMPVLLESFDEKVQAFTGHTENFLPVLVKGEGLKQNQIVFIQMLENSPLGLLGALHVDRK